MSPGPRPTEPLLFRARPPAMKRYMAEYERWMLARREEGRLCFRERLKTEVEGLRGALEGKPCRSFEWEAAEKEGALCSMSSVTM